MNLMWGKIMINLTNFLSKFSNLNQQIDPSGDFGVYNDESLAFLVALKFLKEKKTYVVVKENLLSAQKFYNALSLNLQEQCQLYCVDEVTKFTSLATSPEIEASRLFVLSKLIIFTP